MSNSEKAINLLLERIEKQGNASVKAQKAAGNIIIRDQKLYVNKALLVGSGSNQEMIDPNDGKVVGKTSFKQGKTDQDMAMVVTGIIARYAPAANSSDVTNQPYSEFIFDYAGTQRVVKEILNAEIKIKVGSLIIYEGAVRNFFVNGRESNKNGNGEHYMELKAPKFIPGDQDVQMEVRFPAAVTLPGTATYNHFFQLELTGVATSVKL